MSPIVFQKLFCVLMFPSNNPVLGLKLELLCWWKLCDKRNTFFSPVFLSTLKLVPKARGKGNPPPLSHGVGGDGSHTNGCENVESSSAPQPESGLILLGRAGSVGAWQCSWHWEPQHNNAGAIRRGEEFSLWKGRKGCKKRNKQKRANLGVVSGYKAGQKEKFNLLA